MDFETLLGLAGSVLLLLAIVVLVLWPILVAVIESFKLVRGSVRQPTSFVITDTGATIWQKDSRNSTTESVSVGDKRLRLSVLVACGVEAAFIAFLTVFLFKHADPHGDGMEMAGVGFAFMLIFLPFTLPAFILARNGQWLVLAAGLAALGAFAYFGLWLEVISELPGHGVR
jgi:ABC-type sugar transport system permease subunit